MAARFCAVSAILLLISSASNAESPELVDARLTRLLNATFGFGGVLFVGGVVLRNVFQVVASARSTESFVAATLLVAVGMGQVAG